MMQNLANWRGICKMRCILHDDALETLKKLIEKANANRQALCTEFVKIIKDEERLARFTVKYCNGEVIVLFPCVMGKILSKEK